MRLVLGMTLFLLTMGLVAGQDKPKDPPKAEKDTFDAVIKEMIGTLKKATETLKGVTDEKTAKEAKAAMTKHGEDLQKLQERGQKLGQPSKDQETDLEKKYKSEMEPVLKDFQGEILRVAQAPYGKDLLEALKPKAPPTSKPPEKPKPPEKK